MDASIDTDIVIHLYGSSREELFFHFFDQLYMHAYLYEQELKFKAATIYQKVTADVEKKRIKIISGKDLTALGVQGLFERYKREYEYLFDSGELYAVAMAKAMGTEVILSNDTKDFGPHETLVKELIEDIMPFAFYELLFLKYLSSEINLEEMHWEFDSVTTQTMSRYPMKFRTKMMMTARRFSQSHGTERDYHWMKQYCQDKDINYKSKMRELKKYLYHID